MTEEMPQDDTVTFELNHFHLLPMSKVDQS